MNNDVKLTGSVEIFNDGEGHSTHLIGDPPQGTPPQAYTPPGRFTVNPFEKQQVYRFPRFCDKINGEVGIDVAVEGKVMDQSPGWIQARIWVGLYEATGGSCGGSDNDGNATSELFAVAPNSWETRRVTVKNETEGGD